MKNEVENKIKKALKSREIKPSKAAWNNLENQLDQPPAENSKRSFWWVGIAASFIFGILISTWFYNSSETQNQQKVVKMDSLEKSNQDLKGIPQKNKKEISHKKTQEIAKNNEALKSSQKVANTQRKAQNIALKDEPEQKLISSKEEVESHNIHQINQPDTIQYIKDIAKTYEHVESTTLNAEDLLRQEQYRIRGRKIIEDSGDTNMVNADNLLDEVESIKNQVNPDRLLRQTESELNQQPRKPLKNAVVEVIKVGFQKVQKEMTSRY